MGFSAGTGTGGRAAKAAKAIDDAPRAAIPAAAASILGPILLI
jgi:hypothetical protein